MSIAQLRAPSVWVAILILASTSMAATITWDGTEGDGFWTNGPQDVNNTAFPNNGSTGSNWNIDGTPAQIPTPDAGTPGGNLIDYTYTGHDWIVDNATISEDVQVKLSGGSVMITGSTVSLLPSSANTSATLSGMNLGQATATTATFTNSMINTSRSNAGGASFQVLNGSSLSMVNSAINASAESGVGHFILNGTGSSLTLDATSALNATGDIRLNGASSSLTSNGGDIDGRDLLITNNPSTFNMNGGTLDLTRQVRLTNSGSALNIVGGVANVGTIMEVTSSGNVSLNEGDLNVTGRLSLTNNNSSFEMVGGNLTVGSTSNGLELTNPQANFSMDGGSIQTTHLRLNGSGGPQSLMFDFVGGTVTVTDPNGLRGNNFEGSFDWIGGPFSGSVIQTDVSNPNTTLARKTFQGFFGIEGIRINPTTDPSVSGIPALNAELRTLAVGGAYFQIIDGGDQQTLVLVPEPASISLVILLGLSGLTMRRWLRQSRI